MATLANSAASPVSTFLVNQQMARARSAPGPRFANADPQRHQSPHPFFYLQFVRRPLGSFQPIVIVSSGTATRGIGWVRRNRCRNVSFRSWSFSSRSVGEEHLAAVFVQNLALDPCHPAARRRRELHDEQFGTVGLESAGLTDGKLRRGDAQVVASAPGAWPLRDAARLDGSGQPAMLVAAVVATSAGEITAAPGADSWGSPFGGSGASVIFGCVIFHDCLPDVLQCAFCAGPGRFNGFGFDR